MRVRKRAALLAALASAFLLGAPVSAAAYPTKPVRLIVPFPPGGSTDIVARIVVQKFAQQLGGSVYVDNKAGASGAIGTAEAARAEPDGHTLLIVFDSHATNQLLYKNLKYDTFKSFDYITLMTVSPVLFVTHKSFPVNTIQELVAYAKTKPGSLNYGSTGTGTSNHLNALLFADRAGISAMHIPYKGGGPLTNAILGGEVNFMVASVGAVMPHVRSGALKPLAVGSKQRLAQLPETPALDELLPGYEANSWVGLVAPAGLRKDVLNKIRNAMAQTLADPEVREKLTAMSFQVVASTPEEFERKVQREYNDLGKLIQNRGIQVD